MLDVGGSNPLSPTMKHEVLVQVDTKGHRFIEAKVPYWLTLIKFKSTLGQPFLPEPGTPVVVDLFLTIEGTYGADVSWDEGYVTTIRLK